MNLYQQRFGNHKMKLLLDTHAFIWWTLEPEKLSSTAIDLISNKENDLFLSIASIWEM